MNEHVLRFLIFATHALHTVPGWHSGMHLVWLFPWSVYFPARRGRIFKPSDRAVRHASWRLLDAVPLGFLHLFDDPEYYSMPIYPALALLLGSPWPEMIPGHFGHKGLV